METTKQTVPSLKYLDEFKRVLASYKPSDESLKTLHATRFTLLLAPSSGGRNTVIRELLKTGKYHFMVSDTTRPPRVNDGLLEENGREYWFKSENEVLEGIRKGKYLEAEIIHGQQVSGTNISELETAYKSNQIAITDVDLGGANVLYSYKPEAVIILLLPPGFEEWMRRLKHRGDMTEEELRRRLETALVIIKSSLQKDYLHFVINDNLGDCIAEVHALSHGKMPSRENELAARDHAEQLAIDVQLYLESN